MSAQDNNDIYKGLDSFTFLKNNNKATAPAKRKIPVREEEQEFAVKDSPRPAKKQQQETIAKPIIMEETEVLVYEQEAQVAPVLRQRPREIQSSYKHQDFETMTARLDYEDLEILRALKSTIKNERKKYVAPDGVKRERITENMILRSLVKCFVRHSLEHQSLDWRFINSEEDLFKEVSKVFKGTGKGGILSHEI